MYCRNAHCLNYRQSSRSDVLFMKTSILKKAAFIVLSLGASAIGIYYYQPKYIVLANARVQYYKLGIKKRYITLALAAGEKPVMLSYLHRKPQGKKDPVPVLFVHGFNSTADVWMETIRHFPQDYEVIAVNLPGHGGSGCDPEKDLNFLGITQRLRQFVEAVGLSKKHIHIAGQSMGATVTAVYAATQPNVDRATIIAPAMHTPEASQLFKESEDHLKPLILSPDYHHRNLPPTALIPTTPREMEDAVFLCTNHHSGLPKQILQGIVDLKRPHLEDMKLLFTNVVKDTWEHDDNDLICKYAPKIQVPTLIVWGDRDKVCHISGLQHLKNMLPNCVNALLYQDIGHSVNLVRPKQLAEDMAAFHTHGRYLEA